MHIPRRILALLTLPLVAACLLLHTVDAQVGDTDDNIALRVEFSDGLPDGWKRGVWVDEGLPPGSGGAVTGEAGENIEAADRWVDGHFTVEDGMFLNYRAMLSQPQWYQLFIFCKARGQEAKDMHLYEYKPSVDREAAGEWGIVSCPLSEFVCTMGDHQGNAPIPGEVCWTYFWGFQGRDLGMAVDLVWVTRGKPGSVPAPQVVLEPSEPPPPSWAFDPPKDTFDPDAMLNLRSLNEEVAGQSGFVTVSEDGNDFALGDGAPARFWAVNTAAYRKHALFPAPDLARHAAFLAKRGVNMARVHGNITPKEGALTDIDEQARDNLWRTVAAMKQEGIYTTYSPYWAVSSRVTPEMGVLDSGGEVGNHGLLFFDETLQEAYKSWMRQVLCEPNPHTGIPLAEDPALAIIQLQNEDSLLFWTSQGIKGEAGAELRRRFAEFVTEKYGSVERAVEAWEGAAVEGDDPAAGEVGLYMIWHLTQDSDEPGKNKRCADQMQFFTETMRRFNTMMGEYLRNELGCRQLVNAGNWRTADNVRMLDAERYSYSANEVMAVNRYYTGIHEGERRGWAIVNGDRFTDESVLLRPRHFPVTLKQVDGHPMIVPESTWVPPLGYQSEGPFLVAAYQSLSGVDAFYWFATSEEDWRHPSSANGYLPSLGKWVCHTPMLMGQWPAAALMYRMGHVKQGEPVVYERRALEDLWRRRMPTIAEDAGYDPNRDRGSIAEESNIKEGIDPLAYLVGPVVAKYDADPSKSFVADLRRYIDHQAKTVRSITGELELDYGKGICALNAPRAQGVTGFLGKVGVFELGDVTIRSGNDYASVLVVSMDGEPLAGSGKVLVQVGTVQRPTGWRTKRASMKVGDSVREGEKIVNYGKRPWRIIEGDITISIANPGLATAHTLDANGMAVAHTPLRQDGERRAFTFPADAMYVVLD